MCVRNFKGGHLFIFINHIYICLDIIYMVCIYIYICAGCITTLINMYINGQHLCQQTLFLFDINSLMELSMFIKFITIFLQLWHDVHICTYIYLWANIFTDLRSNCEIKWRWWKYALNFNIYLDLKYSTANIFIIYVCNYICMYVCAEIFG